VRTLWRSTLASVGVAIGGCVVLLCIGTWLVGVWSHKEVEAPLRVLWPLGFSACLVALTASLGTFLNGIGKNVAHAICALGMAVVSFGLKWVLFPKSGVAGVAWATVIGQGVCMAVPLSWIVIEETRRMRGAAASATQAR
jgi:O-antigen/teichoic acid export membrane protein